MQEIWKDIKGYEGLYQVSNLGNVYSIKNNKLLKLHISHKGYVVVCLYKNNKQHTQQIHRLIAQAFIPNPNNLPCVNHKDENPGNNDFRNLEWCTYKYNNNYGTFAERRRKTMEEKGYWCGKKIKVVE